MTAAMATGNGTVAVTLRDAASYLERHGWIQGCYYEPTATVFTPAACLVGAIAIVCYGGPVDAPAQHFDDPGFADFEAALTYLDAYLAERSDAWSVYDIPGEPHYPGNAYDFNDAKDCDAEEVIALLMIAALTWEHTCGRVS